MPSLAEHAQRIADLYQPPAIGRHSDIGSEPTVHEFLQAVGEGNYIETAAKLAGLSKAAVYNWIRQGQSGEPGTEAQKAFVDALEKAEARAEALMVAQVRRAAQSGPQFWAAGMTVLERRHPDRWGKRQDDSSQPKVVVNIGVGTGDVRVGIVQGHNAGLSPENHNDLACANPSQVEILSPIRRNYVNQLTAPDVSAADADQERPIPATGSEGDPTPVPVAAHSEGSGAGQRVQRGRGRVGQRARRGLGKKKGGGA